MLRVKHERGGLNYWPKREIIKPTMRTGPPAAIGAG